MSLAIIPDPVILTSADTDSIFSSPAFRALIAREFRLQAVQLELSTDGKPFTIPAFTRDNLLGNKTLILGAGFDKTGYIPGIADTDYTPMIGQLVNELASTGIRMLEIRTAQHIPCLVDESDKVELNIDLQPSLEQFWSQLSGNTRKNIRRPLKQGFSAVTGSTPELLDEFYTLYRMSLHDIGSLPHPRHFFTVLLAQCPNQTDIFVGYMEGKPVVASFNFTSRDEIYGAWAGIHRDYKKHNVFLAMLWKITEHCATTGRKTYNLGRSSAGGNQHQFKLKLANRSHRIYYYRINIKPPSKARSRVQNAASWLIRNTPAMVMDGLARTLLHRYY